jgi:hypothetical protein
MPQGTSFQVSGPGAEGQFWVNYNAANLRITTAEWNITGTRSIRARIWNNGTLVYDQTKGAGSGTENIPGNHTMVMVDGYLDLPAYLTCQFEIV